jgi:2-polyprenyl-6-methoxyphenol hydroxylase-like FAD-dependent oxidoreductase
LTDQLAFNAMRGKVKPKVVVVGAGPAGLATALTLNKRGIPIGIVERDDRPGTHSYALALHPYTCRKLKEWGVADKLEANGLHVTKLVFCDHKEPKYTLDLTQIPGQESGLLVVGQDHLETALIEPLDASSVPLSWNHRLSGLKQDDASVAMELEQLMEGMSGYAMARLEWQVDKEISCNSDYVVGADGHFSMVRRRLGIEFPKVAPTQSFAVFEFQSDYALTHEARIVFGDEGTSILWALPGVYCRWGFEIGEAAAEQYSRDKDRLFMQVGNQGYHVLESGKLQELIKQRAPWFEGSIGPFRWRMIVRFEKRLAESFGNGRVWLAGDAGHLTGPIGMQSMNIGIREGVIIGNLLADLIEGKSDASTLDGYDCDRKEEWRKLMGLGLAPTVATDPFMDTYADRLLACLPTSLEDLPAFTKALGMELG